MLHILTIIAFLLLSAGTLHARQNAWFVEAEGDGRVTWSADSVADIHAPGGLTLWYRQRMQGDVTIEYEARICGDGRVSDLNCFWMASDPTAKDVFSNAQQRGGRFVESYTMQLYYMGFGGNHNTTTRFRRYTGDRRGVDSVAFRPAILREYTDKEHLITPDHWYNIKVELTDGHARYTIDGETLVDFVDPHPLTSGYFGFRTTLSHAQLRHFRYTCHDADSEPITLHEVSGDGLVRPTPLTFGVPFAQGELRDGDMLRLSQGDEELSTDQWTLASWPDGSVKWRAVATVARGNDGPLQLTRSAAKATDKARRSSDKALKARADATTPHIYEGHNGYMIDSISMGGRTIVGRVWTEMNGRMLPVNSIRKEQSGSVRDVWRMEGDNFSARVYTHRESGEIKIVHTMYVDSTTNADGLHSLSVRAEVPMSGRDYERRALFMSDSTHIVTMDVQPLIARRPIRLDADGSPADSISRRMIADIASWDGMRLSQLSPMAFSVRKRATCRSPWIGTIEGHRAPGVVAVAIKQQSAAIHLTDFWQSYPSTLQVDGLRKDTAVVALQMWSGEAEAQRFEHYDTIAHGLDAAYEDVQEGMSTANGIARTTTLYIYVASTGIDSLANSLPLLAHHAAVTPSADYLHRKRAFGLWSLDSGTEDDRRIGDIVRYYVAEQERNAWYGFFNYGDVMHTYDPDRGEWRYDVGGYAWDNTELATPAMLWYEFLRTGDADTWRMATAMTRHNSEVDIYHRGPHASLGTRHNVLHWGCGAKEARISSAFFNRFMYYLTADERLGDVMSEVVSADTLLYTLDPMRLAQPRSDIYPCTAPARLRIGPDWLAYAGNWFTQWERTGDVQMRDKIVRGMESIAALPHGLFSGPKALGYDPRTGIITWEGDTAVQNTNHLLSIMGGFEMMTEMMLSLSTPAWERVWVDHAVNYRDNAMRISKT